MIKEKNNTWEKKKLKSVYTYVYELVKCFKQKVLIAHQALHLGHMSIFKHTKSISMLLWKV